MRKFLLTIFLSTPLFAAPICTPQLQSSLAVLYRSDEARKVIEEAEKEGPIRIRNEPFRSNSHALWNVDKREIIINSMHRNTQGEAARSILFELHNALATKKFLEIDRLAAQGKISKSDYIKTTEWIEHQNVLSTVSIVNRGIEKGIFPRDMYWQIAPSFDEHFRMQQLSGHAQAIAATYDELRTYRMRFAG